MEKSALKVIFMGTPSIAAHVLQALLDMQVDVVAVVTQPDKKVGRKQTMQASPVKALALEHHLPLLQPAHIRDCEADIQSYQPDMIITCAYGMFLPSSILSIPRIDAINVHASLLPAYRGGAPIHRAIMANETKTGISIMRMVKQMDAGDVYVMEEVSIQPDDTTSIVLDKLSKLAYDMIQQYLLDIANQKLEATKQDESKVSFAPIIKREDERLDMSKCGKKIYNQLRALLDEPGGYVMINDQKVKLFDSRFVKKEHDYPVNTVVGFDDAMVIALKCGLLYVDVLQIAGKKKNKAEAIKHGVGKTWIGMEVL